MSAVPTSRGANPAGGQPARHSSSLLACVRESSPPSDPDVRSSPNDSHKNGSSAEPKKRRFHPLRGLRRMFRRAPRVPEAAAASADTASGQACNDDDHLAVPEVHMRSRSASELMDSSRQLSKRTGAMHSGSSQGGSTGILSGALSLSHDSIFTSDSRGGSSSPRSGSAADIPESLGRPLNGATSPPIGATFGIASHAGVRAELFEAVRRRRGRSRSEDEEEDLGLPSSPYGVSPSTTADEHNNLGAHSTCSDGSLLSMGSNDMDEDFAPSTNSSQLLFGEKTTHLDDMEIDDKIPPLSHIAAKHKIAIKPKRTHGAPRLRRLNTSSSVLPSTPEAVEEVSPAADFVKDEPSLPAASSAAITAESHLHTEPPCSPPLSPTCFEAILERQLKSASLPPGLALVNAPGVFTSSTTTEVKLSRSHSSTEQPNPAQLKPAYRRAVSAAQMEQAALASAAVTKLSAMFGDKKPQEKENKSQEPEEEMEVREKSPERPVPLPRTAPIVKKLIIEELTSPVREIKSILKREPDSPTKKDAPRPAPKPEPRRISMASSRQRVEPVLKQDTPPPPPTPTTPSAPLVSNFVLVSYTDDSLESKLGFESPSSLDSLEDMRRVRSPSYSQMDSLERNLKISSDSLSSSTELSSTSDDIIRPMPKSRPSWTPEAEVRPIKLRSIKSRHSDPPVETPPPELFIRKSSSVDSIISDNNNSSRKTSSNDSLSSGEEVNLRPSEIRRQLKDNEWTVRSSKAKPADFLRAEPIEPKITTEEILDNNKPMRMRLFSSPSSIEIKEKEPQPMEVDVKTPTEPPPEEILQILPNKLKVAEVKLAEVKPEVVLRRKSVLPEAKTEECELFKVFARRSLKLNKDSDNNWEAVGVGKSRDSDKENDEELKSTANQQVVVDKNLINNNVAVSNNNSNNNNIQRRPQTVFIKSEQTKAAEKAARPISFSDKFKWSMQEKEIELVKSEIAAPSGTASLPPVVNADIATIKTLTPKVRKKLDQWERWAQQGGNPQS